MRDLLLRERGANLGAHASHASTLVVRACGVALALVMYTMSHLLGVWALFGAPRWSTLLLSAIVGFLVAPSRFGSTLWFGTGLLCATIGLVAYTPITRPLGHAFLRADSLSTNAGVDAVLVLSGGITADGNLTGQAVDRLLSAFDEARRSKAASMGLSVVDMRLGRRVVTSEADQRYLASLAAPSVVLRFVHDVHSTRDEAVAFAALARAEGWRGVVVVTSPLHTRRACAAFESVGLVVTCRPAKARDYTLGETTDSGNRLPAFRDILYERAATLLYRARGWMR